LAGDFLAGVIGFVAGFFNSPEAGFREIDLVDHAFLTDGVKMARWPASSSLNEPIRGA